MTSDTIWLAAVLLFFGLFAITLFSVSIWSGGERRAAPSQPESQPRIQPEPARRPEPASLPRSAKAQRALHRVH